MTQAEKDEIIKELQEKLAEAEKIEVEQPKRWKPEIRESYYCINCGGALTQWYWLENDVDEWLYLTGNCFNSREEAEEHKKQIEYTARYKNYIEEHSEPIDWYNINQCKYYAVLDTERKNNIISVDWCRTLIYQGVLYASSEQIILDAIKEIGEDNFKKYVLGVK